MCVTKGQNNAGASFRQATDKTMLWCGCAAARVCVMASRNQSASKCMGALANSLNLLYGFVAHTSCMPTAFVDSNPYARLPMLDRTSTSTGLHFLATAARRSFVLRLCCQKTRSKFKARCPTHVIARTGVS